MLLYVFQIFMILGIALSITSEDLQKLDNFVNSVIKCRKVPAMNLVLIKDGIQIHSRGYGLADVKNNVNATIKTRFCIGSLTKAFTSTVIAQILSQRDE